MKKIYIGLLALAIANFSNAQDYAEDFESFNEGDYIGVESDQWTTWSGVTGGAEDAQINTAQANSGTNSIYFEAQGAQGPQDVVLLFNGKHTEDLFNFSAYFYIPSGNAAYFNFQAEETIGITWAIDVYMNNDGSLAVSSGGVNHVSTIFPADQWFKVEFDVNLTLNNWEFLIDDVSLGSWVNEVNAIATADFYPATANDLFWIDDVQFTITEYVLPDLNAQVQDVSVGAIGVAGQERNASITVGNGGQDEITSFDLDVSYNGTDYNMSESGLTLASLENMVIELPDAIVLVEGANPMIATVSNVNGLGDDDEPGDDTNQKMIDPAVPAPNRIVIAEEGTGTWCQWCPRGAVAMDFMEENYHGYYYGIAVHNGDPMVVDEYDDALGFTAFPGAMVDRTTVIDPAAIELDFVERVEIPAAASITTGAQWDGDVLMVSLTYDFMEEISGNWQVVCVLTEDKVTGTSSGYAQSNAYSGGSTPMGGYEDLPNPVPASMMVYDHVARVTSPNANGLDDAFPDGQTAGSSHTFNFTFPISSEWNASNMHIVGMLINNGDINNGGGSKIDEAIDNGYVEGTVVVGIEELSDIVSNFKVYPNPAKNQTNINLVLERQENVTLQIIDIAGKIVRSKDYGQMNGAYTLPIGLNDLESGIYFVNLLIGNQAITQKLIIE